MINLERIPHEPGCYLYKDAGGRIIYIGKAKDLRRRVSGYFPETTSTRRPQVWYPI